MCDPATAGLAVGLIGTAASAAGTYVNRQQQNEAIAMQNEANERAAAASQEARNREAARQAALEEEALKNLYDELPDLEPAQTAKKVREEVASPDNKTVARGADLPVPNVQARASGVDRTVAEKISKKTQATQKQLKGLAMLSALGAATGDRRAALGGLNQDNAAIASKRRGSARVGALEADVPAAQIDAGYSPWGDLLIAGGSAAGNYGGYVAGGGSTDFDWDNPDLIPGDLVYNRPVNSPIPTFKPRAS